MDPSPVEQETPESCRFVKQSQSMSPNSFASYYGHRLPQCALIDEMGSGEGTSARGEDGDSDSKDALRVGQLVVVSAEKQVPTLHARVEGTRQALLSIPLTCMDIQVALLPPNDPEAGIVNRSWERTFTSVSEILESETLPPALNVLKQCYSYKKRPVAAGVILFNIKKIHVGLLRRNGIRGTAVNGTKYTFLTDTKVLFSSRQCDTQCTLRECAEVIKYPQEATVFLEKEESKEFPQLKNLGTLTLTGKEEKRYLVVSTVGGSKYDKLHTLPLDSTTKITAVKLESCEMKEISTKRHIERKHRCTTLPLPTPPLMGEYQPLQTSSMARPEYQPMQISSTSRPLPHPDEESLYIVPCYAPISAPPLPCNRCPRRRSTTRNGSALHPCPRRSTERASDKDEEHLYENVEYDSVSNTALSLLYWPCAEGGITTDSGSDTDEDHVYQNTNAYCNVSSAVPPLLHIPWPCPRRRSPIDSGSDEDYPYTMPDEVSFDKPLEEPHEETDEEASVVLCQESHEVPSEEPPGEPSEESPEELSVNSYKEPPEDSSEEPSEDPSEELSVDSYEEPPEDPSEEPSEDPSEELSVDSYKEPSEDPSEELSVDSCEEPPEDPSKKPSEEPPEAPYEEPHEEPFVEPYQKPLQEPSKKWSEEQCEKPNRRLQDMGFKKSASTQLPQPDNVATERGSNRILHSSSLPKRAACRPTEQQLFHHVARRLGAEWKRFAIYLGFRHSYVQQADKEDYFENKVFGILVAWRNGMGNKSKTWATILEALENAELGDLANEIKTEIEEDTLYCSNSYVH